MKYGIILLLHMFKGCAATDCSSYEYYDVTYNPHHIDSQPDFSNPDSEYSPNLRRCITITTSGLNEVIKLKETHFELEDSYYCSADSLTVYDSNGLYNQIGKYCDSSGPGTVYSTGPYMHLQFVTDSSFEYRGFRFIASSISKDEVPNQLSDLAVFGILLATLVFGSVFIAVLLTYCKHKCRARRLRSAMSTRANAYSRNSSTNQQHPSIRPVRSLHTRESLRFFSNPNYISVNRETPSHASANRNDASRSSPGVPMLLHVAVISANNRPQGPPSYDEATTNNGLDDSRTNSTSLRQVLEEGTQGIANPYYEERPPPPSYEDVLQNDSTNVQGGSSQVDQSEAALQQQEGSNDQSPSGIQLEAEQGDQSNGQKQ